MKKIPHYIVKAVKTASGWCTLPMVYLGVLLLAVFYLVGLTDYDILLILPLLMIFFGIIGYIHKEKALSKY